MKKGVYAVFILGAFSLSLFLILWWMQTRTRETMNVRSAFLESEAFRKLGVNSKIIFSKDFNQDSIEEVLSIIPQPNFTSQKYIAFSELMILQVRKRRSYPLLVIGKEGINDEAGTMLFRNSNIQGYLAQFLDTSAVLKMKLIPIPTKDTIHISWNSLQKKYEIATQ